MPWVELDVGMRGHGGSGGRRWPAAKLTVERGDPCFEGCDGSSEALVVVEQQFDASLLGRIRGRWAVCGRGLVDLVLVDGRQACPVDVEPLARDACRLSDACRCDRLALAGEEGHCLVDAASRRC
jgi:hypothetical protein